MRFLDVLRLGEILTSKDFSTGVKVLKRMTTGKRKEMSATLFEIRQLDQVCNIAFGEGLARFVPAYFFRRGDLPETWTALK